MERSPHLDPKDYDAFDVLEYQFTKHIDVDIMDHFQFTVSAINAAQEANGTDQSSFKGTLETLQNIDDMVRLPNGSYVAMKLTLEAVPVEEAEHEVEMAKDEGEEDE